MKKAKKREEIKAEQKVSSPYRLIIEYVACTYKINKMKLIE